MRTLLVIPALNEESKIGEVVKGIPGGAVEEIVVVDDGSNDKTSEVAKNCGATVLRHDINMGVGASIRSGIDYAIKNGFDAVVVISGDNQHEGKEIERVVGPIAKDGYQFVQGSRYLDGGNIINKNFFRFWGIKVYTFIFRALLGTRITDGTNGFRAFKTEIFSNKKINIWQDWLNRYELEPYLLFHAGKMKLKMKEVPVTIRYHRDGSYTKMKGFKSWWSLFRPILYLALGIRR